MGEYWRREITLRQLRVLVEHLPPDSALHRAARGHAWTDETYLLALVADLLQISNAQVAKGLGARVPKPKPLPRPKSSGQGEGEDRAAAAREAHRRLAAKLLPR